MLTYNKLTDLFYSEYVTVNSKTEPDRRVPNRVLPASHSEELCMYTVVGITVYFGFLFA